MKQHSFHTIAPTKEMLILEVHPFLVDPPPSWGKLKMCKLVRVLKPKEKLGLYNINEIIFLIVFQLSLVIFVKWKVQR